jgi:uncharacterized membrane protein
MMKVIFCIGLLIALLIGFDWEGDDGMVVAGVLYILAFLIFRMNRKITDLEKNLNRIETLVDGVRFEKTVNRPDPVEKTRTESEYAFKKEKELFAEAEMFQAEKPAMTASPPPLPDDLIEELNEEPERLVETDPLIPGSRSYDVGHIESASNVERLIRNFFTQGNVVVKIGWVILFFGVGFLLKFASDRNMFPVEVRYIAVSACAIALLGLGWSLREKMRNYALLLQGGAIGLLYMTVFAAAKIHHLVPMGFAFFILVCLAALSGILAVLQDARMTAAYGAAGGFLAPILTSTGSGSHVMLFSYYAVLNSGILGIAWFKSWRELNLIGFVFTFGIGGLWGLSAYRPEHFLTTEPFLILFFIYFAVISILFAIKQPDVLKGYVDGSLVFGLPVVTFTLQGYLVKDMPYGLAVSAISLSVFYLIAARTIWSRKNEHLKTLTEAFLALGVVFGSLALPLSLDGRWTAAAWAMEGAALIWIGGRQNRLKARLFGLLLQAGAGISFLIVMGAPSRNIPVFNGFYLGCIALSVSGLFSSYMLQMSREQIRPFERDIHVAALVWGLIWWCGSSVSEIDRHIPNEYQLSAMVAFAGFSAGWLMVLYGRLTWPTLKYPLFSLSGVLALLLATECNAYIQTHPFGYFGWIAWIFALGVFYISLYRHEDDLDPFWIKAQHLSGFLLVLVLLCSESSFVMSKLSGARGVWTDMIWGLVPALCAWGIWEKGQQIPWPVGRYETDYKGIFLTPVMAFLVLWFISMGLNQPGDPHPLSYIPIINPIEIIQLFVIFIVYRWIKICTDSQIWTKNAMEYDYGFIIAGCLGFFWMNTVIGRSVHVFTSIPFYWETIWRSMVFQASLSVFWTSLALVFMVGARKKANRILWFTGAGLLGLVVIKLFLIDLSNSRAVARIVSFLATGILMLVIGFFSPLPPRKEEGNIK